MRTAFVIAVVLATGCGATPVPPVPKIAPDSARVVVVPPLAIEPKDGPSAGRRLAEALHRLIQDRVEALGHARAQAPEQAEVRLECGAALEFHPAGDVKRVRLFVRVEERGLLLDDWVSEEHAFYFVPPRERDLEAFADEIALRLAHALEARPRSR